MKKNVILVAFDTSLFNTKHSLVFIDRLKRYDSYQKIFCSCYLITTTLTCQELYDELKVKYFETESIFLVQIHINSSYYGLFVNDLWVWLKTNLHKIIDKKQN